MTPARSVPPEAEPLSRPHALTPVEALHLLATDDANGLEPAEAARRLESGGPNILPLAAPAKLYRIILQQFRSPLIYILLVAALVSMVLGEWADAAFIFGVLVLNAAIGAGQEYGAERGAASLRRLMTERTRVVRGGVDQELETADLVPGDILLMEAGERVPADARLLTATSVDVDESLLTGESMPVAKRSDGKAGENASLGDQFNMLFAGTTVLHGRARAVITATGQQAQIGRIATSLAESDAGGAPLLQRMERFTRSLALGVGVMVVLIALVSYLQGEPVVEMFHVSVALAVAVIPEGLPVAITIALAIASRRMARRNVIVRRLVAVEALGSCTFIASDKTGTLTMNELTVVALALPGAPALVEVSGPNLPPEGEFRYPEGVPDEVPQALVGRLARAAVLVNEGFVGQRDDEWTQRGDAVDVSLLSLGWKVGTPRSQVLQEWPERDQVPFESDRAYAASLHGSADDSLLVVKGAIERLLPMCSAIALPDGVGDLDHEAVERQVEEMAERGMKVLAVAERRGPLGTTISEGDVSDLTLLGLVGMTDPLRPGAREAVEACHRAGIEVALVTGDHATTALAIARDLSLADRREQVVTGADLRHAQTDGDAAVDQLLGPARVFARMEPEQKLDLVHSFIRQGHFVAVTGDGVNDAPALRAAHVGVAMGRGGTDVARDASELILTDDNFASVVAGVEEGRVAYANVRKVVYLLISTGLSALLVVLLAFLTGLPLPLLPVQLLWLNLVTSGIQDVALAFEPAEGDELDRRPRSPHEPIFNRLMMERVALTAVVIAGVGYLLYRWLLADGADIHSARNLLLLQLVLFQNIVVGNARSETHSGFRISPLRNPLLLFGVVAAQLIHIGALYTPGLSDVLALEPISLSEWIVLLGLAMSAFVVIEVHKFLRAPELTAPSTSPVS